MSLFDEMMKNEEYKKLFDQFADDQKPLIIDRIRLLMNEVETKMIEPLNIHIKDYISKSDLPK